MVDMMLMLLLSCSCGLWRDHLSSIWTGRLWRRL